MVTAIAAIILIDFAAQPIALYRIDRPAIFQQLAAMPPGAVCVLPLGLRDGIGELGRFEHRALADQITHGKPIVGGFIARLPKTVFEEHAAGAGDRLAAAPVIRRNSSPRPRSRATATRSPAAACRSAMS